MMQWLFYFYFYCFFGWCFESTYVSLKTRRPVNRGFMRGPFLPLYGSGAVMMLVVSRPFQDLANPWKLILTYIAGCIGATILEYVTGVVMEALFKVRYWDYSKNRFNYKGQICLGSSLAWGFLTILMTEVVHRPVARFVEGIPGGVLTVVTFVVTIGISVDFALSFKAALDLRDVLIKLEKAKEDMAHVQKRVDVVVALLNEDISKRREELQTELAELRGRYRVHQADRERLVGLRDFFQRNMIRSNPTMVSGRFGESLRELQDKLEQELLERRRGRK
ncbi:MAG: putative ABC transporter permease [Clostridium sp.]|nr:putative ABC transporter permease [Acetatifactor muris]MCM1527375.1 putative ABC transporter permease [Bacteroides sp.]MCM1563561.1 putative ABC transporter permease [Clostridium sp.]